MTTVSVNKMKVAVLALVLLALASATPKGAFKLYKHPVTSLHAKPNPRIVGGQEAIPHSLPYQAAVIIYAAGSAGVCGGSLISQNYVITAAHCLLDAVDVDVVLGAHELSAAEDTKVALSITDFKIHEDFDIDTISNDIAVIKLPRPVELTDAIQTISLPSDDSEDFAGSLAIASGWGLTSSNESDDYSDALQEVEVAVIANQACQNIYGSFVTSKVLCTSDGNGVGICSGDSGGPLATDGQLIGVSSFSSVVCGEYPSGFTRISSYIDWIKNNTDV